MRKFLILAVLALAALAAAYLAGLLPERRQRAAAEAQAAGLQEQLAAASARLQVADLLGQALTLKDVAARQNYGQARELSSTFFDAVQAAAASVPEDRLRQGLNDVLSRRDEVTAALARGEPAVTDALYQIERRLREALGYAMPSEDVSPTSSAPPAGP